MVRILGWGGKDLNLAPKLSNFFYFIYKAQSLLKHLHTVRLMTFIRINVLVELFHHFHRGLYRSAQPFQYGKNACCQKKRFSKVYSLNCFYIYWSKIMYWSSRNVATIKCKIFEVTAKNPNSEALCLSKFMSIRWESSTVHFPFFYFPGESVGLKKAFVAHWSLLELREALCRLSPRPKTFWYRGSSFHAT